MNRNQLETYILQNYSAEKDYPWVKYPDYSAFRCANKKCFAFFLNITKDKLGLDDDSPVEVVNLKCSPLMIGSLIRENEIFPGYHMNKEHWITVLLDGSVPNEEIKMLLDMSYELTFPKQKIKNPPEP